MRGEFVKLAGARTMTFSDLCERFGISRKTGYDWLKRFREEGMAGLLDRSRRPKSSPHKLPAEVEREVLRLRQENPRWGSPRILRAMTEAGFAPLPSLSSVDNILRRHREGLAFGNAGAGAIQSSRIAPNAVWRVEEGPAAEALDRLHCAVAVRDLATDFVLGIGVGLVSGDAAREEVLWRCFSEHGLPSQILWTLGAKPEVPTYRNHTSLTVRLLRLGVVVEFSGPLRPAVSARQAALEVRLREVDCTAAFGLPLRAAAAPLAREPNEPLPRWRSRLARWREAHNFGGTQEGGPRRSPLTVYRRSARVLPGELPLPTYPADAEVRLVSDKGMAHYRRRLVHIGRAFAGLEVEFRATSRGETYAVLFGQRMLGLVELAAGEPGDAGSVPLIEATAGGLGGVLE